MIDSVIQNTIIKEKYKMVLMFPIENDSHWTH